MVVSLQKQICHKILFQDNELLQLWETHTSILTAYLPAKINYTWERKIMYVTCNSKSFYVSNESVISIFHDFFLKTTSIVSVHGEVYEKIEFGTSKSLQWVLLKMWKRDIKKRIKHSKEYYSIIHTTISYIISEGSSLIFWLFSGFPETTRCGILLHTLHLIIIILFPFGYMISMVIMEAKQSPCASLCIIAVMIKIDR